MLALLMLAPSILCVCVIVGFLLAPNELEAGFVVFGILFYVPFIVPLMQLVFFFFYKLFFFMKPLIRSAN